MDGLTIEIDEPINVLGTALISCSTEPLAGFFRDGCCNTNAYDYGSHTVCCVVTKSFLQYSRFRGNDLSTPRTELGFPGLREGDRWCLCATRWREAYELGMAPRVVLEATHRRALDVIPLDVLLSHTATVEEADHA